MEKYIRTKEGYIIEWNENMTIDSDNTIIEKFVNQEVYGFKEWCEQPLGTVLKQADTIEELIQDGDMLYIHDLHPDAVLVVEGWIKPFGYHSSIKLELWLTFKDTEYDLYIKQPNEDYHKVAEKKQSGKLVLYESN